MYVCVNIQKNIYTSTHADIYDMYTDIYITRGQEL